MTQFWLKKYKGKSTGTLGKDYFLLDKREVCEKMDHFLCDTWGCGSHLVTERRDVEILNHPGLHGIFPLLALKVLSPGKSLSLRITGTVDCPRKYH